jgi:hypothetical protein
MKPSQLQVLEECSAQLRPTRDNVMFRFAGASSQAQTSIRRRPACESQDNTPEVKGISQDHKLAVWEIS